MNEFRKEIESIIKNNERHFSRMIKNRNELYEWVKQNTLISMNTSVWPAVIYSAVHQESNICKHGHTRLFDSITRGFKVGCGNPDCACVKESRSRKVSESKRSQTQEQKDESNRRRAETNLREHGVANIGQTKKARAAHAAVYANKEKVDEITAKNKATKLANHGNENYNNTEKIKESLREVHTAEYWIEKTGNQNYTILYNKEELTEYINEFTILELVEMFGVAGPTILRHARKFDIQLPVRKHKKCSNVYEEVEYTQTDQLNNKYSRWYYNIIERAKLPREEIGYMENHHIIPECFYKKRTRRGPPGWLDGDANDPENLVRLTGREHFICHWLLTKMYEGQAKNKMIHALVGMKRKSTHQDRYDTKITSRVYDNVRAEFSKLISNMNKGRVPSPEERQRISDGKRGKPRKPYSEEYKQKKREANSGVNNPMHGRKHSEETKRKISERATGRKFDPEVIARRSEKVRGSKRERKICPHCGKDVAVNTYAMWHGDNCKHKV